LKEIFGGEFQKKKREEKQSFAGEPRITFSMAKKEEPQSWVRIVDAWK